MAELNELKQIIEKQIIVLKEMNEGSIEKYKHEIVLMHNFMMIHLPDYKKFFFHDINSKNEYV